MGIHCTALLCDKWRRQWPCAEPLTIALRSRRKSFSLTHTLDLHVSCIWVTQTPKIIPLSTWKLKHNSSKLTFAQMFLKNGRKKPFLWKFTLWILHEADINYECTMKVLVINNLHFKLTPSLGGEIMLNV